MTPPKTATGSTGMSPERLATGSKIPCRKKVTRVCGASPHFIDLKLTIFINADILLRLPCEQRRQVCSIGRVALEKQHIPGVRSIHHPGKPRVIGQPG